MLARVRRLLDRDRRFAFDDEEIEAFPHQGVDRFGKRAHDAALDRLHGVKHRQRRILKNGIGVEDQETCLHNDGAHETVFYSRNLAAALTLISGDGSASSVRK